MEEMLTNALENSIQEPLQNENSQESLEQEPEAKEVQNDGQSIQKDPSEELILGKFKSVDELVKAYSELQKFQGESSKELGDLRKESSSLNLLKDSLNEVMSLSSKLSEDLGAVKEKYNKPEYFQEPTFRNLFKEAYTALGENLDSDKFVELLESYVKSRIIAYDKSKLAKAETEQVIDSMTYEKNSKTSFTPPKKHFDEMTSQEIDELLEKLI